MTGRGKGTGRDSKQMGNGKRKKKGRKNDKVGRLSRKMEK